VLLRKSSRRWSGSWTGFTHLDALVAQTTLLSNERAAVQISGQRMAATDVLVRALGRMDGNTSSGATEGK
jgi:outer membrane protein TolC